MPSRAAARRARPRRVRVLHYLSDGFLGSMARSAADMAVLDLVEVCGYFVPFGRMVQASPGVWLGTINPSRGP